jgi:hypothetical protein
MRLGQRYMQGYYASAGSFRPSYEVPSVINTKFKGVPHSVFLITTRLVPADFSHTLPRSSSLGPQWPNLRARAIHSGDIEAALTQDCHKDFVGHSERQR